MSSIAESAAWADAASWKRYAQKLEAALEEANINSIRQASLKKAALAEIERLDPKNRLLDQGIRKQIADDAVRVKRQGGIG